MYPASRRAECREKYECFNIVVILSGSALYGIGWRLLYLEFGAVARSRGPLPTSALWGHQAAELQYNTSLFVMLFGL